MKARQRFAASGLFCVLACFAAQVFADAVITSAFRNTTANIGDQTSITSSTATTGSFLAGDSLNVELQTAVASQDSSIDVLQFGGIGSTTVSLVSEGFARSLYTVFFDLSVANAYSLSGHLEEQLVIDAGSALSIATFQLIGPTTNLVFNAVENGGELHFAESGLLEPGSYLLALTAFSGVEENNDAFSHADWQFDLTLRVLQVPEPATLVLVGLGLLGLGFARRRKR